MENSIYKSNETVDNLIITLVKIYPLTLRHTFRRASEITGRKASYCQHRYYSVLRHEHVMFTVKTDLVELVNVRRLSKIGLSELEAIENKILK